jgi:hypothetical protein
MQHHRAMLQGSSDDNHDAVKSRGRDLNVTLTL